MYSILYRVYLVHLLSSIQTLQCREILPKVNDLAVVILYVVANTITHNLHHKHILIVSFYCTYVFIMAEFLSL